MSKSTRQSLLLLSIVHGSFKLLIENEIDEKKRTDLDSTLLYADTLSFEIIRDFETTGDERKNFKWIREHFALWKTLIDEENIKWPSFVLIFIAGRVVDDLLAVVRDKKKRESFVLLREVIFSIMGKIDSGTVEKESEYIDILNDCINKLYKVIEFDCE